MPYSERPHTIETKKEKPKPEDQESFNLAKSTERPVLGPAIRNLLTNIALQPFVKFKNR